MREFNAFRRYPSSGAGVRLVTAERAEIGSRIIAAYRGPDFYDGDRDHGYGGLRYDGRWAPVARDMIEQYGLDFPGARVLQIGCDKGYLIYEFHRLGLQVVGTEVSQYAIATAPDSVARCIEFVPPWALPFEDQTFDLVICAGPVYSLTLEDSMRCLREVMRVCRGRAFVTMAAYETHEDFWLFRGWTLLGATVLKRGEWLEVLEHVGYVDDYEFTTAQKLGLAWA